METLPSAVIVPRGEGLETFLRGMETSRATDQKGVGLFALKPSLEGWKPAEPFLLARALLPLKPSLEGWKRVIVVPSPGIFISLETFLRGMETVFKSAVSDKKVIP